MRENEIGTAILGAAIKIHSALGPGLLESAYEACLAHELALAGFNFERQKVLSILYDGIAIERGYRLDLLVEGRIVIEVKAVDQLSNLHRAQVLSYLRLGGFRLGYLLNFNVPLMKDGIARLAN